MVNTMEIKLSAQDVAFVAIFAALSAIVTRVLPGIPVVGVSGANINFTAALAPVYGMIIGPYFGFLAALLGGLVMAGSPFDILTSFSPAVSALIAGLLTQKSLGTNENKGRGWMIASVVLGLLILGWYVTDIGRKAPFYPILHFAGLGLILATRGWTAEAFKEGKVNLRGWGVKPSYLLAGIIVIVVAYMFSMPYSSDVSILPYLSLPLFFIGGITIVYGLFGIIKSSFVLAVSIASYCGIIADHMLGNLVFIGSINVIWPLSGIESDFLKPLGLPDIPSLFMYMIPTSTVERLLFTVIATILGVGLVLALRRANLTVRRLTP
jgi:hypothetical protein